MKKISTYVWQHKFAFLFAVLSMVISISLDMLSPQLTRHIVDDVIIGGKTNKLIPLLIGIYAWAQGGAFFNTARNSLLM